jgi:serine/threonine-protein kinase
MPEPSDQEASTDPALDRATPTERIGAPPPLEEPGAPLFVDGRYQVESEVGRGGMGIVYLAKDVGLGRPVALKMIAPVWARSPEATTSFLREAQALASIRSQYVVQVYAFGPHEGSYFFAMEYVRGRTLRQIMTEHREHGDTIPQHRTLTILSRIAQGLDAVHATGIVHRDVKPANIVIEEDTGRPALVDFGLAVPSDDPSAALAIGTPHYMAPEQAGVGVPGATVTERTDVYALGIIAFEMLAGQLPFHSTDRAQLMRQHARKKPPALSSLRRDLAPFDPVIACALAKDPAERYPSCTAFAEALAPATRRWINSTLPTLPPPPPSVEAIAGPDPARAAEPERPFHVLVVDDSPVFRKFAGKATQLALFRHRKSLRVLVDVAGSGSEAVARAELQPPDLLLLDFDMPGLDGVDTLSRLRALPGGDRARVVVLSGRVAAEIRWRFTVLGVSDFVSKPIDFQQLVDRIEGIARRFEEIERSRPI